MGVVSIKELLEAGVHFGHQTNRWNPKMKKFLFGERNGIYIIDLQQTLARMEQAYAFVRDTVAAGQTVLFVGTKRQAAEILQEEACARQHVLRQPALARRDADELPDHPAEHRQDEKDGEPSWRTPANTA